MDDLFTASKQLTLLTEFYVMIEVFKTNVEDGNQAQMLVELIHTTFVKYTANFDLMDCDNILRIKSNNGMVESNEVIRLLKKSGVEASVLPDDIEPGNIRSTQTAGIR